MESLEKINLAKKIVSSCFNKSDKNYGLYFLTCYGLLSKFGDEYLELVEEFFFTTEFYIGNAPLTHLVQMAGIRAENIGNYAISYGKCNVRLNEQFQFEVVEGNPKLCMSTQDKSANDCLTQFTHESAHLIKELRFYLCKRETEITVRGGLRLAIFDTSDIDSLAVYRHTIMDEVVNVFQTADMMQSIGELERDFLDDEVKYFYDRLNLEELNKPSGYERATSLLNPLWENENFKDCIEDNIVMGNIGNIISDFDRIMGEGSFVKFSSVLDGIFSRKGKLKTLEEDLLIKNVIFKYNRKTLNKSVEKVKR